jgi:excisionase family DNA binding protein
MSRQIADAVMRQEQRRLADIRKNRIAERAARARATGGRLAFSVEEVAAALDKNCATIWRWIRAGRLRSFKVGNSRMVSVSELDRLMSGPTP